MLIVNSKDFSISNCDSLSELIDQYNTKPDSIEAILASAQTDRYTNLFYRFRVTEKFEEFYKRTMKKGYAGKFIVNLDSDKDIPKELTSIHGANLIIPEKSEIDMSSISDCLYIENIPQQMNAISDYMQFELGMKDYPNCVQYDITQKSGLIMSTPKRTISSRMHIDKLASSQYYFIPIGTQFGLEGIGFIANEAFVKAVEWGIRNTWSISIYEHHISSNRDGESVEPMYKINAWSSDSTLWDAMYFIPYIINMLNNIHYDNLISYSYGLTAPGNLYIEECNYMFKFPIDLDDHGKLCKTRIQSKYYDLYSLIREKITNFTGGFLYGKDQIG